MDNNKIMTTKELAEYMKLNEKTILKMAQNGDLPGVKIGNQWRFNLASVDQYLQRDIMHTPKNELDTIIRTAHHIIPLSRLIDRALIKLDSSAQSRDEILLDLATTASEAGVTAEAERLFDQLKKRENMLSTAVGSGVAVPHPRNPSPVFFKKPNIMIIRSIKGIDFSAPDKEEVRLFFMVCAPNVIVHLRLLAKISKLLQTEGAVQKFMKASSKEEIIQILLEFERNNIIPQEGT